MTKGRQEVKMKFSNWKSVELFNFHFQFSFLNSVLKSSKCCIKSATYVANSNVSPLVPTSIMGNLGIMAPPTVSSPCPYGADQCWHKSQLPSSPLTIRLNPHYLVPWEVKRQSPSFGQMPQRQGLRNFILMNHKVLSIPKCWCSAGGRLVNRRAHL